MKFLAISTVTAAALLAVAPAQAQQGDPVAGATYFGVSLSQASYEETGRGTANPTTIGISLGKYVNKNFALEGRFATGLTDDNVGGGGPQGVTVDYFLGAYAKGILPISPRFSVYGIAGVTYGDLSADSGGLRFSGADADFSYGVGVDYMIGGTTSINFEWARLFDAADYKLDALTVGLHFRF